MAITVITIGVMNATTSHDQPRPRISGCQSAQSSHHPHPPRNPHGKTNGTTHLAHVNRCECKCGRARSYTARALHVVSNAQRSFDLVKQKRVRRALAVTLNPPASCNRRAQPVDSAVSQVQPKLPWVAHRACRYPRPAKQPWAVYWLWQFLELPSLG